MLKVLFALLVLGMGAIALAQEVKSPVLVPS